MAFESYQRERGRADALQAEKDARARLRQRVGSLGSEHHVYRNPPPVRVSAYDIVALSVSPDDEWAAGGRWQVQNTQYCKTAGANRSSVLRLQGGAWASQRPRHSTSERM